jgi:Ca-activated chloride channel family protein
VSFLAPAAFFLAALLPVIILMYLLKLRRTERLVSSTYLWRQMLRDVEANAPWQRLRRNLLLLLQLLFLIALIFSIARPFTRAEGLSGQAAILILDASASMAATDVTPSRIEAAKDQAQRLVDEMSPETRLTVIAAAERARVVVSSSTDRRQVHQVINEIQAGSGGSDLGVALQIASAIASRQPDAQTIILSDGNVSLPSAQAEMTMIKGALRYLPIGLKGDNQAIGLLNLQRAPGGGATTAFAQVLNYGSKAVNRRIAFFADGQMVNAYDLSLPPGGEQSVLVEGIISTTHQVEAQLLPADPGVDFLSADDRFIAIQRPAEPLSITLFSQGNLFLETALALMPGSQVTRFDPADEASITGLPAAALTILDGAIPLTATLPSSGSLLFIGPLRSSDFFQVTGLWNTPNPEPADADSPQNDPLLQYVDLKNVNILDAARIPLPLWARPVILAQATTPGEERDPLLFAGEVSGRRVAVLAFDLRHSDLPLQVSFPILLANLIQWLAPTGGGEIPTQIAPGVALTILLPPSATATVTLPDGEKRNLIAQGGQALFNETGQLGLYQVDLGASGSSGAQNSVDFAVNLASPQESRLEPAQTLPVAGLTGGQGAEASQGLKREWWRLVALIALLLLVLEWLVYHRPTLAMLYRRFVAAFGQNPHQ